MSFTPTDEQRKIIAAAKTGDNLVIQALAGTGKTTTLKLMAEALSGKHGTYVAFNKAIVAEAVTKFPSNVKCRTAHSLAFAGIGHQYQDRLNKAQRLTFVQMANWMDAPKIGFKSKKTNHVLNSDQVARFVMFTVRNFCKSVDAELNESHVEIPFLISLDRKQKKKFIDVVLPMAKKSWEDICKTQGYLKFSHDYYLKMWQLSKPKIKGDFILFDEAQDADPVMLDVIESQDHAQTIYCGDQFQAIYEWRGAKNALESVDFDRTLWLTQSFRFGDAIADEANDILTFLKAPVKVVGFNSVKSSVAKLENPDAILCRTNAGVIQSVITELEKNRKVAVIGRTEELIDFSEACGELQRGRRTGHPELAPFESWAEVKDFAENYPEDAQEIKVMIDLVDKFGVTKLVAALKRVVEEPQADVVVSTAHKAKGREWKKVKLHGDYLHPVDMEDEDLRLAYVSVTRAMNVLDMSAWELAKPLPEYEDDEEDLLEEIEEAVDSIVRLESEMFDEDLPELSRVGARWSLEEDQFIIGAALEDWTPSEMALRTGRSLTAIEARLAKWISMTDPRCDLSTIEDEHLKRSTLEPSELSRLVEMCESDFDIATLVIEFSRPALSLVVELLRLDLVAVTEECFEVIEENYA